MPPRPAPTNEGPDPLLIAIGVIAVLLITGTFIGSVLGWYSNALNSFYGKDWARIYTTIKYIIIGLDLVLVIFVVLTLQRFFAVQKKQPAEASSVHIVPPLEVIREAWDGIERLAGSKNPSDWNMAVLRADALLDDILRDLGYEGDTISDRLKIVDTAKLKSIEAVWSAHRLRNIIAHDPVTQHMHETIDHALKSYAHAFRELELMEEQKEAHREVSEATGN